MVVRRWSKVGPVMECFLTFLAAVVVVFALGLVVALVEVPVVAAGFLALAAAGFLAAAGLALALAASLTLPDAPLGRRRSPVSAPRVMALLMALLKAASDCLGLCLAATNFLMACRLSPDRASSG